MSDFVVREATLADRDTILGELSDNIYNGFDYIPCCYQRWLHDDEHTMLCVEERNTNTIVGFEVIGLYDGGRTAVYHALRVHPAYRGQGVAKLLGRALQERTRRDFPSVTHIRSCVQDKNPVALGMHYKQGYKPVSTTAFRYAEILKPVPRSVFKPDQLGVKRVSAQEVWGLLSRMPESKRLELIPGNALLVDWIPRDACIEGLTLCCSVYSYAEFDPLRRLFLHSLCYNAFGCNHVLLSYDMGLRRGLPPREDESARDYRMPPAIADLQTELSGYIDCSADTIGCNMALLQKPVE
ncbi:hypothetical protein PTSG_09914 [Salpingoeca rosetta]|uniref:N-acetyltransferase domain-containing protein n=1 Tax=Salpingoeca rosetta (strain ATCC 50818 / BSB-021) TaxID=946362 RepID=F2UNI0_SALR5|nr:uncharacterized protein PTSG_09914 [Salpingoeca rosetta]EGD79185.1 hypothetical protein PTSG_09914 [Salpingoeca rosetta]|eukprot:XP_004989270.1 hypothetical protein PTSG_09914 [Salpingoeca rosetta]